LARPRRTRAKGPRAAAPCNPGDDERLACLLQSLMRLIEDARGSSTAVDDPKLGSANGRRLKQPGAARAMRTSGHPPEQVVPSRRDLICIEPERWRFARPRP